MVKLLDREAFGADLERVVHHGQVPIALAMSDLDGFGDLNDRFGREAADRVLRAWERALTSNVPRDAVVGRLGGDEYAVALPGATAESALIMCEEIRAHFAAQEVDGIDAPLNASIGIAAQPPHASGSAELLTAAGQALMRAKREGRGRTAIYVDEKMVLKTTYYPRASLDRLSRLSGATGRTEASLLREGLDDLLEKHREET